jgi:capsular polysaccharide export protein
MIQLGMRSFFGKHVLLLQGPLGPFFNRLSHDLMANGAHVSKINFNGGDWLFYPRQCVLYRGSMSDWPDYFSKLLAEWKIDVVLMYGDCRPMHDCARARAEKVGVKVGVFEAGYIRPNYITLEESGINDYSLLPRDETFYLQFADREHTVPKPVGNVFWHAALWAILYYIASSLLHPWFKHYQHHRRLAVREAWPWIKGLWRKYYFWMKERNVRNELIANHSGKYFLVPLQVYYDSQIHVHSDYLDVETFIKCVVEDFAKTAPADTYLVLKHHPMDRAYRDYTALCTKFAEQNGITKRVLYVHDLHLPTVYKHAQGVVVVNSTVGLSALMHGMPVKVCGRAMYDIKGLTYTGALSDFWKDASTFTPNARALRGFEWYLIEHTQLNGSVYKRLSMSKLQSGLIWNQLSRFRNGFDPDETAHHVEATSGIKLANCASDLPLAN